MSKGSRPDDELRFRPQPGKPQQRGQPFVNQVLRQANKAGTGKPRKASHQPGARLGRGHVAARFSAQQLPSNARRVTIKTRLVNLRQAGKRSTLSHLRYIERDGVSREGDPGQAYGPLTDQADLNAFEERGRDDRHQFRFIVSPEDAEQLDDLRTYTRHLMSRMEADLGTRLDWVAVDHWNTDNPHTHIVLRGKDDTGKDLVIARDYIAEGMRNRASELATEWLGPRTELEIQQSLQREVQQERFTSLDRTLLRKRLAGGLSLKTLANHPRRQLLIGRLQQLQKLELAHEVRPGQWLLRDDAEATLRAMGERGDIVRTLQRAMGSTQRELALFEPGKDGSVVVGRIVSKGLADELNDRGYLVVDGLDGKAHYLALPARAELADYPIGGLVETRSLSEPRAVDRSIVALAADGLYRTDHHLALARSQAVEGQDPEALVERHVRRLEALRRAGIVERLDEGVWRVPADLPEQGRQHDARRLGDVAVELRTPLPLEQQVRAVGATWLDQQLIGGNRELVDTGFGKEVREALRQRADFLVEQGLAERQSQRVALSRNLLATLRGRELAETAREISAQTGMQYRQAVEGKRVSGIYRRSVQLASGRYALLDDGIGFSLVPWKPVIEQKLGQSLSAVIQGNSASWQLGRQRGPSIG
ncbi:type VI secretion protein [Ectopseudomonas mendocina]|nr:type VI secretion protein [Pseudomonas mendocina]